MQPSIPDAKYHLQKFRHAQKAKFLESILGLKVIQQSGLFPFFFPTAIFVCFNFLPVFFSLAGHLPGFISEGKNFW